MFMLVMKYLISDNMTYIVSNFDDDNDNLSLSTVA